MIVRPAGIPPKRVSGFPGQEDFRIPIGWIDLGGPSDKAARVAQAEAEYLTIPEAIRTVFEQPTYALTGAPTLRRVHAFKYFFGETEALYSQTVRTDVNQGREGWSAFYAAYHTSDEWRDVYISAPIKTQYAASTTIVHEFGHHIDKMYQWLWPDSPYEVVSNLRLRDRAPWPALWAASSPTIPSVLYGATNSAEWFAELWRVQIQGDGAGGRGFFYQLAGNDLGRALAIRAAFEAILPMPPFEVTIPEPPNLLASHDPGFEDEALASWEVSATVLRSTFAARSGAASLQMTYGTVDKYATSQAVPVTAGRTYRVRAWVRAVSGTVTANAIVLVIRHGATEGAATADSGPLVYGPDVSGEWVPVEATWVAPAGSAYARVRVRRAGYNGGSGALLVDDVSLQDMTSL